MKYNPIECVNNFSVEISGGATLSSSRESELHAFLRQIKLEEYAEVFIAKGADDLQYLLEAKDDTEELDSILAEVGMDTKPIHVRKFKRRLNEWGKNSGVSTTTNISTPSSSNVSTVSDVNVHIFKFLSSSIIWEFLLYLCTGAADGVCNSNTSHDHQPILRTST